MYTENINKNSFGKVNLFFKATNKNRFSKQASYCMKLNKTLKSQFCYYQFFSMVSYLNNK